MLEGLELKDGQWSYWGTKSLYKASRVLTNTTEESGNGLFMGGLTTFYRGKRQVLVTLAEPKTWEELKANADKVLEAFKPSEWTATALSGVTLKVVKTSKSYRYYIDGKELNSFCGVSRLLSRTSNEDSLGIFDVGDYFFPGNKFVHLGASFDLSSYEDPAKELVARADKVFKAVWGVQ